MVNSAMLGCRGGNVAAVSDGRVVVTELHAGPPSPEGVTAVLAERDLTGAITHSRSPFIDLEVRQPPEVRP